MHNVRLCFQKDLTCHGWRETSDLLNFVLDLLPRILCLGFTASDLLNFFSSPATGSAFVNERVEIAGPPSRLGSDYRNNKTGLISEDQLKYRFSE